MRRELALAAALALAGTSCGGDTEDLVAVGTLERIRIELVAEAHEPIVEIALREGDHVERGDLVLRLDGARGSARVKRAQAARDQAAARLAELERGPRAERIAEGRARLAGAVSSVATSRREYERAEALAEQNFESESRLDLLRADRQSALARRDEARAALEAMLDGTTVEELDQARSALLAAEAELTDVSVQFARLEVRAPRDGQIDALPYELGERPPTGSVVAVLLAGESAYARVYIPEPLRARVRRGSAATVRVDGVERLFEARVRTVSSEPAFTPYYSLTQHDRSRLSYLAEIDLLDPAARELPTGLPVEVRLELDPAPELASRESDSDVR